MWRDSGQIYRNRPNTPWTGGTLDQTSRTHFNTAISTFKQINTPCLKKQAKLFLL